jgi:hypothetical protein
MSDRKLSRALEVNVALDLIKSEIGKRDVADEIPGLSEATRVEVIIHGPVACWSASTSLTTPREVQAGDKRDTARVVDMLREMADDHDKVSPMTPPTYTSTQLRRIADALPEHICVDPDE